MVLDRNPDNFFAETEQVAFHPGHVVPGIDFTNDPLLQGRLFSYLDTQLIRLGGPNFHEIADQPAEVPDAQLPARRRHSAWTSPQGRVAYEPNSLEPDGPRESPSAAFVTFAASEDVGRQAARPRPRRFADHYSQARLFWRSMTEPEQRHIVSAFAFELGKVETRRDPHAACSAIWRSSTRSSGDRGRGSAGHGGRGRADHAGARADRS